jgi:hypothetical protein
MASKTLTSNVYVDGTWYGPSYPANKVTDDVLKAIENPAAFEAVPTGASDLRTRADDFAATGGLDANGDPPSLRAGEAGGGERAELEKLSKDELLALADARQVEVKASATKAELVDALAGPAT